ncbi:glycosyltransferase family 2 protein [Fictibacillus sp. S7]|uniref:glycosyltransferase family 2 protein n=1 Tax=Fictibacillus sp. S7 TaxID=2212476 RepID=UPI0010109553|nr:glycosyltransferase family 2 protein [Fictibacillus sp. S7]RXZ02519.1 glycosyltransferase [Fictibacillus sp. S7]
MDYPYVTIVIPCYNEEDVLEDTLQQLGQLLENMIEGGMVAPASDLLFVDDGSKDNTWDILEMSKYSFVKGLKLTRNSGHQNALYAGLMAAKDQADCVISIDADLQDDINAIPKMIEKYMLGNEIVYGVRSKRDTDTFFKRTTALGFYRFMSKIGIDLVENHADFRLISSRALHELSNYKEQNLFLRGLVPLIGLPSSTVAYERKERKAGESKYPLKKMLSFAFDGITSFSVAPIRLVTIIGLLSVILSSAAGLYALTQKFLGHTESGWTSLIISIWLIGGLQLLGIGLLGEYIGKIFTEVKRRPKYAIEIDKYTKKNTVFPSVHLEGTRND